jgi:predicted ArsR family transcriptional regulator
LYIFSRFDAIRTLSVPEGTHVPDSPVGLRVLDCKAGEHDYLHKDFHGALCYGIKYLDDHYGPEATAEFLRQVARSYYAPLSEQLKKEGLAAIEKHWREIFTKEGGKFSLEYQDGALVLTVHECPAIAHLRLTNQLFTPRFCETTVVVNETICGEAGYMSSCQYEPGEGRCVQRFWKSKG